MMLLTCTKLIVTVKLIYIARAQKNYQYPKQYGRALKDMYMSSKIYPSPKRYVHVLQDLHSLLPRQLVL